MPKLCDGNNGQQSKSAIGIGHTDLYKVQLETYATTAPSPPTPACLIKSKNSSSCRTGDGGGSLKALTLDGREVIPNTTPRQHILQVCKLDGAPELDASPFRLSICAHHHEV